MLAETPPQAGVVLVHALDSLAEPAAGTQFATRASASGGSCFGLSRGARPGLFTTFRLDFSDATRQTLSFSRAFGASGAPEREFLPMDPLGNWLPLLDAYAHNAYHVPWAPSGR